jgi:predicted SAM-dependent methyltransferase
MIAEVRLFRCSFFVNYAPNAMIKKIKYILKVCQKYFQYFHRANQHYDKPVPVYTKPLDVGLKVHLGAGPINIQGWVNIDARSDLHIHLQSDGFDLNEFVDGALSEIYMCHVLEHFSFEESKVILNNLYKKLKVGGVLRLSVPDFDGLIAAYHSNENDLEFVKKALMGGQDYMYNYHKSIYNKALLTNLLLSCNYSAPEVWSTQVDFGIDLGDWSTKHLSTPKGGFPISLNIKALKSKS